MRVASIPDYSQSNPYQTLLPDALANQGVTTTLLQPSGPLPVLGAVKRARSPDVLHLHWTWPLLDGRAHWGIALRAIRLVAELALLRLAGTTVVWTVHNLE